MKNKDYYENQHIWAEDRYTTFDENKRMTSTLNLIPKDVSSILDVGCGNGQFLKLIENSLSVNSVGLEPSQNAIEASICKSEIINATIISDKITNNSFDVVSCLEVLEHLRFEEYRVSLEKMIKVSKKYIIISVPFDEQRVQISCPYCKCNFNPSYHLRKFNLNDLKNLNKNISLISYELVAETNKIKFYNFFKKIGLITTNSFSYKHVCPQCGFKKNKTNEPSKSRNFSLVSFIKKPFYYKSPRWIVCLYEKK